MAAQQAPDTESPWATLTSVAGQLLKGPPGMLAQLAGGCCGRPNPKRPPCSDDAPDMLPDEANEASTDQNLSDASHGNTPVLGGLAGNNAFEISRVPEVRPSMHTGRNSSKREFVCGYCGAIKVACLAHVLPLSLVPVEGVEKRRR